MAGIECKIKKRIRMKAYRSRPEVKQRTKEDNSKKGNNFELVK